MLVNGGDTNRVEIRIARNFELTASVVWPEESTGPQWTMVDLLPDGAPTMPSFGQMKSNGTVQFERVYPGRYVIGTMGMGDSSGYLASVLLGGRDVLGQSIELTHNSPPLQFVYKRTPAAVSALRKRSGDVPVDPGHARAAERGEPGSLEPGHPALALLACRPGTEHNDLI